MQGFEDNPNKIITHNLFVLVAGVGSIIFPLTSAHLLLKHEKSETRTFIPPTPDSCYYACELMQFQLLPPPSISSFNCEDVQSGIGEACT